MTSPSSTINQKKLTIDYDVIIAGAGPAGATAAYFLTRGGLKVLILEKKSLPRYKPCGGGVSLEFLKSIFPFSFETVINQRVTELRFISPPLDVAIPCEPDVLVMVNRDAFDHFLVTRSGAVIMTGKPLANLEQINDHVIVTSEDGSQYTCRFLIGADGANSRVTHLLGLGKKRLRIPAVEGEIEVPGHIYKEFSHGPVFIFTRLSFGYAWIFPRAGRLAVGIAGLRPKPGQLVKILKQTLFKQGIDLDEGKLHMHPIPVYTRKHQVLSGQVLLCGDAAGLVDPLSGEGIRVAITSGKLAAEAILCNQIHGYPQAIWKNLGWHHLASWWVGQFFYRLRFLCLLFGAPNPYSVQLILDIISGKANALTLFFGSIISLPFFLLFSIIGMCIGVFAGEDQQNQFYETVFPGKYRP
jgi:geranylgeranyl reductase family protein